MNTKRLVAFLIAGACCAGLWWPGSLGAILITSVDANQVSDGPPDSAAEAAEGSGLAASEFAAPAKPVNTTTDWLGGDGLEELVSDEDPFAGGSGGGFPLGGSCSYTCLANCHDICNNNFGGDPDQLADCYMSCVRICCTPDCDSTLGLLVSALLSILVLGRARLLRLGDS